MLTEFVREVKSEKNFVRDGKKNGVVMGTEIVVEAAVGDVLAAEAVPEEDVLGQDPGMLAKISIICK